MSIYDVNAVPMDYAYNESGSLLFQAYDINGNPLLGKIVVKEDASSGTDSGYYYTMVGSANTYVMRQVANFMGESPNYQSLCYDSDRNVFYRFDATTTVRVYDASMTLTGTITLPSRAGHNNDSTYYNGIVYMPTGVSTTLGLWAWDVVNNTVSNLPISGVTQPTNGSARIMAGVFKLTDDADTIALVYQDYRSDNELYHAPDDMWSIYYYSLSSGIATLKAEFPWDCYAVQGAAVYDGILYVTCNLQTADQTAPNDYKGVLLKAVRTDTWEELPSLKSFGAVEPEGLNIYPFGTDNEFMMGLAKYQTVSKMVRFTIPYRLKV